MTRILVVGDALLDRDVLGAVERVCPDAPVPVVDAREDRARPGGAGLAAALLAADGVEVALLTAIADDEAGHALRALLAGAGVEVYDLGLGGATPEKVRIRADGQSLLRLDRGGGGTLGTLGPTAARALEGCAGVLVADYGRGVAGAGEVRALLAALPLRIPVVWDPHPLGPDPIRSVRLATPNVGEAARLVPEVSGTGAAAVAARAAALAHRWQATGVAVTMGARGALLAGHDGPPFVVPAPPITGGDPCGAGDRFAGAAALALARGSLIPEAVEEAVARASAFVAAGGADGFSAAAVAAAPTPGGDVEEVLRAVRASGGTVVATGGCFDLLHAGHVGMLQAARRLGDCLVVLLNADTSVARLKGPDRPVQSQDDRAAVLAALDCVDAVVVFDEDTPVRALERIQPDVFAKGADYAVTDLPEARTLARWGGQAVVVPYLGGRSTTRLIEEAARRART